MCDVANAQVGVRPRVTLAKQMGDQSDAPERRGPGNPAWVKGGPSPNPSGRPRAGLACAEKIREQVDPADWIAFELAVATDPQKSISERRAAWLALIDRGFVRPAQEHNVSISNTSPEHSYSHLSEVDLDLELARLDRLALQPDHADPQPNEPIATERLGLPEATQADGWTDKIT